MMPEQLIIVATYRGKRKKPPLLGSSSNRGGDSQRTQEGEGICKGGRWGASKIGSLKIPFEDD